MSEGGVSVIVVARDEEDRIERCLRSVLWADERIVIVDAATRDATTERAQPLATDLLVREWEGFAQTRAFAAARARGPWILWIDADEEVSPELTQSIRRAVADPRGRAGFRIHRRNRYLGQVIRHGAWSSDIVTRLFRKESGAFDDRLVHESVRVDGSLGTLTGCLEHQSYRNLAHHWEKMGIWAGLWATQAQQDGKRARVSDVVLRPPLRFIKGYVLRAGLLDGAAGIILAFMDAVYVGTKYARLLELQGRQRPGGVHERRDNAG